MRRTRRSGAGHQGVVDRQPLPRVDPALILADLLDDPEASVLPAFDNADLDGLPIVIRTRRPLSLTRRSPLCQTPCHV
jgi:hypothetical protein